VIRYLKRSASYRLRKRLAETLLLSKLNYCNSLFFDQSACKTDKLDRVLKRIASFVTSNYCTKEDVIKLRWLPTKQNCEFSVLKLAHKSIHKENFPNYLKGMRLNQPTRSTRREEERLKLFQTSVSKKTFAGKGSRLMNELPQNVRLNADYNGFSFSVKTFLLDKCLATYYSSH